MKTKNVSFTIPQTLSDNLAKESNKSKVVTDALNLYYSQRVTQRIEQSTSLEQGIAQINAMARRLRPRKLTPAEIIKYKNRGRK